MKTVLIVLSALISVAAYASVDVPKSCYTEAVKAARTYQKSQYPGDRISLNGYLTAENLNGQIIIPVFVQADEQDFASRISVTVHPAPNGSCKADPITD